jgi:Fe-S-cluster containining protein
VIDVIKFECTHCGDCCTKILRKELGVNVGMYLRFSEIRLFNHYPLITKPYIGIGTIGSKRPQKILCYQLAVEPCPFYSQETKNHCTKYDQRPIACKAYPFAYCNGKTTIDEQCTWFKMNNIAIGDVVNTGYIRYAAEIALDFIKYSSSKMPDSPVLMIFDVLKKEWVKFGDLDIISGVGKIGSSHRAHKAPSILGIPEIAGSSPAPAIRIQKWKR